MEGAGAMTRFAYGDVVPGSHVRWVAGDEDGIVGLVARRAVGDRGLSWLAASAVGAVGSTIRAAS
jgi:hypothetical protein